MKMFRILRYAPLAAMCIVGSIWPAGATTDVNVLKYGVVKIRNNKTGQEGSGFIVALDKNKNIAYIITVAHVVGEDDSPSITFYSRVDKKVLVASMFKQDLQKDGSDRGLALLTVNHDIPTDAIALPLDTVGLHVGGDAISIIGSPRSSVSWAIIVGNIKGLDGSDILFSGDISEGVSGGPVTKDNKMICGIVTATGRESIAIPATQIRDFLKGVPGSGIPFQDGLPPSANRLKCISGESAGCISYFTEVKDECDERSGKQYPSCMARANCWRNRGFALMASEDSCDEKRYSYNAVACIQSKQKAAQLTAKFCDSQEQ